MWSKVGAVLVLSITVFTNVVEILLSMDHCRSCFFLKCTNHPKISLSFFLFPLYGAHWQQLDNHLGTHISTAFTVINTLLSVTDPSCEETLIRNSSTFGISKKHKNTRIRDKRDQRNQIAWKTFVACCPSPFLPLYDKASPLLDSF